jgi:RND family efflux transporter MFP subunit
MRRSVCRWLAWMLAAATALSQAAEFPAVLDWSQRLDLSSPVAGVVESVRVMPGQEVKAGDLLLALDAAPYKAQVAEARAEADRLLEEEADARRDLSRVEELYARTVSATTELDAARLRHARARHALAAAEARVERARWQLARSELRAPFGAVVLARQAEPGMVVASQCAPPPLLSLARDDELVARARLTAGQASGIRIGREVDVSAAGRRHKGKVRAIIHDGAGEAPYMLEVALPRSKGLVAGLAAHLRLP